MVDWEPVRFRQYTRETELGFQALDTIFHFVDSTGSNVFDLPPVASKYTCILKPISQRIVNGIQLYWPVPDERKACESLVRSCWILRVRVNSVDSTLNTQSSEGYQCYTVFAHVQDTLKGGGFPDWCSSNSTYMRPDGDTNRTLRFLTTRATSGCYQGRRRSWYSI